MYKDIFFSPSTDYIFVCLEINAFDCMYTQCTIGVSEQSLKFRCCGSHLAHLAASEIQLYRNISFYRCKDVLKGDGNVSCVLHRNLCFEKNRIVCRHIDLTHRRSNQRSRQLRD